MHQIRLLADPSVPLGSSPPKSSVSTPIPLPQSNRNCNPIPDFFSPDSGIPLPPNPFSSLESQHPGSSGAASASSSASTSTSSYSMPILCTTNTSGLVGVSGSSSSLQPGSSSNSSNGLLPFLGMFADVMLLSIPTNACQRKDFSHFFLFSEGGASLLLGSSPPSQLPRFDRPAGEALLGTDDACSSNPSQL